MALTLSSELEVVNHLLNKVGEYPVATLDSASNPTVVSIARTHITSALRRVLQRGWECNTWSKAYTPDSEGRIAVGYGVLEVYNSSVPVSLRGGMLFNLSTQSFKFGSAVNVEAVYLLELTDLPQALRDYVAAEAAYSFQSGLITDSLLLQITAQELMDTRVAAAQSDARMGRHNMISGTPDFQRAYCRR